MAYSDQDYTLRTFLNEEGTPPYRGFQIVRQRPWFLYEVRPKDGYDLPPIMAGKFTNLELLKQAVDTFLAKPKASAETAYKKQIEQPKRGRPKKVTNEQQDNL